MQSKSEIWATYDDDKSKWIYEVTREEHPVRDLNHAMIIIDSFLVHSDISKKVIPKQVYVPLKYWREDQIMSKEESLKFSKIMEEHNRNK